MVRKEAVDHPDHYGGDTPYETIKVIQAKATKEEFIGFSKWTAYKYIDRATKSGREIEDYKKASWYLNNLVKFLERPKTSQEPPSNFGVLTKDVVLKQGGKDDEKS